MMEEQYYPCRNPACKSYGVAHPNCKCSPPPEDHTGMEDALLADAGADDVIMGLAKGGVVEHHFCRSGIAAAHNKTCQYFDDGGNVEPDLNSLVTPDQYNQQIHGTIPQQALAGVEGLAESVLGPVAPAIEDATGLTTGEDIRGRAVANPATHVATNIAGFIGSQFVPGLDELGLAGMVRNIGEDVAGALPAATSILGKVATTGIKAGAEMAALSASDELSKLVTGDPTQTLGTAAANIGLSGIIGSAGGVALGGVSSLFGAAAKKTQVAGTLSDAMGEVSRLQQPNPEDIGAARNEYSTKLNENDTMLQTFKKALAANNRQIALAGVDTASEAVKESTEDSKQTTVDKQLAVLEPKMAALQASAPTNPDDNFYGVKEYLGDSQKLADKIRNIHYDAGVPLPEVFQHNPTPNLNFALGIKSDGTKLGNWMYNAAVKAPGEAAADAVGAGLGFLVGHPLVGSMFGSRVLGPVFKSISKPLMENAIDSEAARGVVNYIGDVIRGQRLLDSATAAMFTQGAEVIAKNLIPDQESRSKLQKSLDYFQNPQNAAQVGGSLGHYMPQHATAAAATAATANNYLSSLKPKAVPAGPFDAIPPIDKAQQVKYNRALDVAQQPLLVLKYAKDGTLLPQDVNTIQTIYPGLHSAIVNKLTQGMIEHKAAGNSIPYAQRVAMNMLIGGSALDNTMAPTTMQAIMRSSISQQQAQQQGGKGPKRASGVELKQIDQYNSLISTKTQAEEANRKA